VTDKPQHSKPVRLAHAALVAGVDGKWKRVEDILRRLNTECPGPGLGDALVAWCDAMAQHAEGGEPEFQPVRIATMNADTGGLNSPEGNTPELRWAGRLIAARAAGDRDQFVAVMDELNAIDDGFTRGRYVVQLVESVALVMRTLPYGYARMGRGVQ
jgi:hypothetical protein